MTWPRVRLGDVCDVTIGATPARNRPEYWGGSHVWVTVSELNGGLVVDSREHITDEGVLNSSSKLIPAGTLLFSFKLSIGKMAFAGTDLYTNEAIAALPIRDSSVLDSKYLYYCLSRLDTLANVDVAAKGKVLNKAKLKQLRIPLPSLSEQRRIVEILDQADRLRRLRAEADAKADRILPALFIKMFGDPATNPMGWPVRSLGELCDIVSGATPKTNRPEYWNGAIAWATPKDLSSLDDWVLESTERTLTEEGLASCSATMMPKETVLLSSRAPIGLVALSAIPICTNQGFKSLVSRGEVDPWYLFAWCKLRGVYLQSLGRGATFKEISKRIVERVQIPVPPMDTQKLFRTVVQDLRRQRLRARTVGQRINDLLALLLQRAFSGSLTASWREAHINELLQEMQHQAKLLTEAAP